MTIQTRRDTFQAIADPIRRGIIVMLSKQSLNLNAIAENFEVSRPAISQHIKILIECGMVTVKKRGRERYCEMQMDSLSEVTSWVENCRKFWNQKLDALENFLDETNPENQTKQ